MAFHFFLRLFLSGMLNFDAFAFSVVIEFHRIFAIDETYFFINEFNSYQMDFEKSDSEVIHSWCLIDLLVTARRRMPFEEVTRFSQLSPFSSSSTGGMFFTAWQSMIDFGHSSLSA